MLASAGMQTIWAGGSTPKQMSPAEVQHLRLDYFPGASFPRPAFPGSEGHPAVGSPQQEQQGTARRGTGHKQKGQLLLGKAVSQQTPSFTRGIPLQS